MKSEIFNFRLRTIDAFPIPFYFLRKKFIYLFIFHAKENVEYFDLDFAHLSRQYNHWLSLNFCF